MQQPPNSYSHYPEQPWPQPNQFSRVFPSWEDISQFKQPLTDGEWCLLKFLDDHLKKDELFQSNDLTKYNG